MINPQHYDSSVKVGGKGSYNFDAFGDEVYTNMGFELILILDHDSDAQSSGDFDISSATASLEVAPYGDAGNETVLGSGVISASGGTDDTVTFTIASGVLPTSIPENYAVNGQGNAVFTVILTQGTKVITLTQRTNLVDPNKGLTSTTTPSSWPIHLSFNQDKGTTILPTCIEHRRSNTNSP